MKALIIALALSLSLYSAGCIVYALWATFGWLSTLAVIAMPYIALLMVEEAKAQHPPTRRSF